MLGPKNNHRESTIEISKNRVIKKSQVDRMFIVPIIAANAIILATMPVPKTQLGDLSSSRVIIDQGNGVEINSYPTVKVKYEYGKIIDLNKYQKSIDVPFKMNSATAEVSIDVVSQQIIGDLRRENNILRNRLQNSIPMHTLFYMIGSSICGSIAVTLLAVRFLLNIYIIDPYYLICAAIISVGLFLTSFTSLKDWKDNLLNERIK